MCIGCGIDLSQLSDDQIAKLSDELNDTLCVILKVDLTRPRTVATEESLSTFTTKAWKKAANAAVASSIGAVGTTKRQVATFLRKLGIKLSSTITADQAKVIRAKLDKIYKSAKRVTSKAAKTKFSFTQRDARALKTITKHQVFWIDDFYSAHLSTRIRAVSEEIMLQRGLSNREAGKLLGSTLRREFGIIPGGTTPFAPGVPARFAGNPDLYFRGVASTAGHQSRTFASIEAMSEAEIVSYQLINPGDERTGQICQVMNGQVFTVQVGVKHMERQLAADNPKAIRDEIAPWHSGKVLAETVGKSQRGSSDAAAKLAAAGAILPPFHPLCRTEPVILAT